MNKENFVGSLILFLLIILTIDYWNSDSILLGWKTFNYIVLGMGIGWLGSSYQKLLKEECENEN